MARRFTKTPKRATRRANGTLLRDSVAMLDDRIWNGLGKVLPDGAGDHWTLHDGKDVTVRVELQPSGILLRCRLSALAAGPGIGAWKAPPIGAEVAVLIPDGQLDAGGIIVGVLSTGALPDGVDGSNLVIVVPAGAKVLISNGSGGYEPVVKKSEFEAHLHPTGTGPSGTPSAPIQGTGSLESA